MVDHFLTKSDFKLARTCPTKLYYRKKGYPTVEDGDEQLTMLADQGYLIEALARTLYPDGRLIGFSNDVESAAWDTMSALSDNCTLFEATFISGGLLARVDILIRRGNVIELIEIKSRGFNRGKNDELLRQGLPNVFRASKSPDGIQNDWRPYLEDAAFQTNILQQVFPDAIVIPYLLMPDTSQTCQIDGLHRHFSLRSLNQSDGAGIIPISEFTDEPRRIRRNPLLCRVNVREEVSLLLPEVRRQAREYQNSLLPSLRRITTAPSTSCRSCEFRVTDGQLRGFQECWGEMAGESPHILDLYYVSQAGGRNKGLVDKLISQGKASLYDVPLNSLFRRDGNMGEYARRQRLQIECSRDNREWISDDLAPFLNTLVYPLFFIDFETCAPAIPHYRGMRPFEVIAYQWSCHTVDSPNAEPQHSEWLQSLDTYPNEVFAASLRQRLGEKGSILIWSKYEVTVLRAIQRQLLERYAGESDLLGWIDRLLDSDRIVDLNQVTLKYYFHPRAGGRTSLKVIANAVWQTNPGIRRRLPQYATEAEGGMASPYQALPLLSIGNRQIAVSEGVGATVAYFKMMERTSANAALEAEQWRRLLQQYCQLDTMAMVMVWWHWLELTGKGNQ